MYKKHRFLRRRTRNTRRNRFISHPMKNGQKQWTLWKPEHRSDALHLRNRCETMIHFRFMHSQQYLHLAVEQGLLCLHSGLIDLGTLCCLSTCPGLTSVSLDSIIAAHCKNPAASSCIISLKWHNSPAPAPPLFSDLNLTPFLLTHFRFSK